MLLVGLTGGIGCGKSTAVKYFRSHDILLIDADEIARQVVEPGQSAYQKLRDEFGSTYFDDKNGGKLIREKLGDLVFKNPEVLFFYGDCCIICFFRNAENSTALPTRRFDAKFFFKLSKRFLLVANM